MPDGSPPATWFQSIPRWGEIRIAGVVALAVVGGLGVQIVGPGQRVAIVERDLKIETNNRKVQDSLLNEAMIRQRRDNNYYLSKMLAAQCLQLSERDKQVLALPCDDLLNGRPLPSAPTP